MKHPRVKLHWAERFINWYPQNTKLYLSRIGAKEMDAFMARGKELFHQLVPFFDELKKEAYIQGYRDALKGDEPEFWDDLGS